MMSIIRVDDIEVLLLSSFRQIINSLWLTLTHSG